jgi:hypothetical protein
VTRPIIVHSLEHALAAARAAEALGCPVTLASAPGAGIYAGAFWFKALIDAVRAAHPDAALTAVIDCGESAGASLAALRAGLKHIRFSGAENARGRLAAIAEAQGAMIEDVMPEALDLLDRRDPEAQCRAWLAEKI